MDPEDVKKLIELMERHGLAEIEIEDEKGKIRLKKDTGKENVREIINIAPSNGLQVETAGGTPAREVHPGEESAEAGEKGKDYICSPLVGTFYRRPDPESDPYVSVGDHVTEETVVCIVEAMKVMNEIKAEKTGTITRILVEDAHPVEYKQQLFEIEPD